MVELRWKTVYVDVPHERDDVIYKQVTKVLQYRQMIDTNIYAGLNPAGTPNMQWSAWVNVPDVPESAD